MKSFDYYSLLDNLHNQHFYPKFKVKTAKGGKESVIGLRVECPPILVETRTKCLAGVLGEGFLLEYHPKEQEIHITVA